MLAPFPGNFDPEPMQLEPALSGSSKRQSSKILKGLILGNQESEEEMKATESTGRDSMSPSKKIMESQIKNRLRPRKVANYQEKFEINSPNLSEEDSSREKKGEAAPYGSCALSNDLKELSSIIHRCNIEIAELENTFFMRENEDLACKSKSDYPDDCVPIAANILDFDFQKLVETQKKVTGQLFDVILMDPPWQLSSSNPTRGVAIAYDTLSDSQIQKLPIRCLQDSGFLFIWTINAKFSFCFELMKAWGYQFHDEICWVKQSVNGKIAKGHGFYLQHSKESCLIGVKGDPWKKTRSGIVEDVVFSARRGQSQKPPEVYDMIEAFIPHGYYLEIFGRRNNLRPGWVTIGNEL